MKKYIIFALMLLSTSSVMAQSGMTDDQVMSFVAKEHSSGTSNSQIVTKLMQRGVDISQIRRVREKYEKMQKQGSLASATDRTGNTSRLRSNNGKTRSDYGKQSDKEAANYSNYRVQAQRDYSYRHTYDSNDEEYGDMQNELNGIVPDSTQMLKQLLAQQAKDKHRVFGRDIFNNKELSFEPNMNIATPQNYRLGPGDAVIIDIYGASQRTIQSTVSPDGEVTIEGYGPVNVSGLTVFVFKGVKSLQHSVNRLNHREITPASRRTPNCILIAKIIRPIAVLSYPHRSRCSVLLLNQPILFHSFAKHSGVIFTVRYIGRTVIRSGIAGFKGIFLMYDIVKSLLNFIAHFGFVEYRLPKKYTGIVSLPSNNVAHILVNAFQE